jgi:hypothetical protein
MPANSRGEHRGSGSRRAWQQRRSRPLCRGRHPG